MQSYAMAVGSFACPTTQHPQPKAPTYGTRCTHCGIPKHNQETCYKLHGYLDWWEGHKGRKVALGYGRAALITTEPQLSLAPQASTLPSTSSDDSQIT
ncbi:unnamed protein product [Prunus armeniaca]